MDYTITTNANLTADYFGNLVVSIPPRIGTVVYKSSIDLRDLIKSKTPVRTGRLRDSIQIDGTSLSPYQYQAYIGSDVEYANAVEFGTVNSAPKPFMRSSINGYEPIFIASLTLVLT